MNGSVKVTFPIALALTLFLLPCSDLQAAAVLVFSQGRFEAVDTLPSELPAGLEQVWLWSEASPPVRLAPAELAAWETAPAAQTLEVRVRGAQQGEAALSLRAAPLEMWQQVPEALLPAWQLGGRSVLRLPRDGRPWRLRLVGEDQGSWWLDVRPRQQRAVLVAEVAENHFLQIVGADRQPLASSAVTALAVASTGKGGGVWAQWVAGPGGAVELQALPDHASLKLILSERQHASVAWDGRVVALPPRVQLPVGATVRGRFLDPAGEGLEGVEVKAEVWLAGDAALAGRGTTSDPSGAWSLAGLPAGEAGLLAHRDGFAPFQTRLDLAAGSADLGEVTLQSAATLVLIVRDDRGRAVAGAALSAGGGRTATTDAAGQARLAGVSASEPLRLEVSAAGHLAASPTVQPPFPKEPPVVVLQRAFGVTGRLLDAEGVAVAAGSVRVEHGHHYQDYDLQSDGRFELDLQPGLPSRLLLRSLRTRELAVHLQSGRRGELRDLGDLLAPQGVEVRGRLLRQTDGSAITGARVWAPRLGEQGALVAWAQGDLLQAQSGATGEFEFTGLPRQPTLLRIDAPGLARRHLTVDTEESLLDLGEIYLQAGSRVLVFAEDVANGATVRLDLRRRWMEMDMLSATVVDGQAEFLHVPPGLANISVLLDRKLLCEQQVEVPEAGLSEVDCQQSPLRVSGSVTVGGEPASGGRLLWQSAEDTAVHGLINHRRSALGARSQQIYGAGRPQVEVSLDGAGEFFSEGLRPGTWSVLWLESGAVSAPQRVELPAVAVHAVRLNFPGRRIAGVVLDSADQPVPGARVQTVGGIAVARTDAAGAFTLTGLEMGVQQLFALAGARSSEVVVVAPEDREPVYLVLAEEAREVVEIRVGRQDGGPAAGAFVFLERDDHQSRRLTLDSAGVARVELRPPYPRRLRAAAVDDGGWVLGAWEDLDSTRQLYLESGETGAVKLEARQLEGWVELISADGWNLSLLRQRIGVGAWLSPELPLVIGGLPEGEYTLRVGEIASRLAVAANDLLRLEVD